MFEGRRYLTSRIDSAIPVHLLIKLWECVDEVKQHRELGKIQTFSLYETEEGEQGITHTQAEPVPFMAKYVCEVGRKGCVNDTTVIIVDYGENSIVMFPDEYIERSRKTG